MVVISKLILKARLWWEARRLARELGIRCKWRVTFNGKESEHSFTILAPELHQLVDISLHPGEPLERKFTALAHEMRHLYQYDQGWLRMCDSLPEHSFGMRYPRLWRGEFHCMYQTGTWRATDEDYRRYEQLPWERDAIEFEHEYARRYRYTPLERRSIPFAGIGGVQHAA